MKNILALLTLVVFVTACTTTGSSEVEPDILDYQTKTNTVFRSIIGIGLSYGDDIAQVTIQRLRRGTDNLAVAEIDSNYLVKIMANEAGNRTIFTPSYGNEVEIVNSTYTSILVQFSSYIAGNSKTTDRDYVSGIKSMLRFASNFKNGINVGGGKMVPVPLPSWIADGIPLISDQAKLTEYITNTFIFENDTLMLR